MSDLFSGPWLDWFGDTASTYGYAIVVLMGLALVFLFLSPLCRPQTRIEPVPEAVTPEPVPVHNPSVLVVDDSAVVRAKLRKLLEGAGYQVVLAQDGVDAEEQLAQQRFHVLITDLEMPRMDGFALVASVVGNMETESLPIIAITGHDALQARVRDCEGVFGIFQKPWNDRELLKRVAALAQLSENTWLARDARPSARYGV